jgi:DNA-binding NarL/FixJ family response regulator
VKAIIVDDHTLFVDVMRGVLERMGAEVVAVAGTAAEALTLSGEEPDLVLVDVGLPDQSGIELGQTLLQTFPNAKILALTALDDAATVQRALRAGFHGYLTKDTPVQRFATVIGSVLLGSEVFPSAGRNGRSRDPGNRDAALLGEQLTARERDVLHLLVQGKSGPVIARELGISRNTVRTHVQSVLTKLQVHSRLEAAAFAVRYGLVDAGAAGSGG